MGAYDVVIIGTNACSDALARHVAPSASASSCPWVVIGSLASRLLPRHADTKNEIPLAGSRIRPRG
jgi:hypothetical protein